MEETFDMIKESFVLGDIMYNYRLETINIFWRNIKDVADKNINFEIL